MKYTILILVTLMLCGCFSDYALKTYYPYNEEIGKRYVFTKNGYLQFMSEHDMLPWSGYFLSEFYETLPPTAELVHEKGSVYRSAHKQSIIYYKVTPYETELEVIDVYVENYNNPEAGGFLTRKCRMQFDSGRIITFTIGVLGKTIFDIKDKFADMDSNILMEVKDVK